ncbi:MAG: GNAT family N-acetyltransferase [Saprospiraceae bacterium]|nr:GNAT family N-acetyltransferase [Saprospiraceae bacterium]
MTKILRTSADHPDFKFLVKMLDVDLAIKDGDEHSFYAQFNKINAIKYVILLYENEVVLGCGAIKEFDTHTMEIKRMYVIPPYRNMGYATEILCSLEKWASEMTFSKCILETGKRQQEAIELYLKNGYTIIPNYGQYAGVENSICFEKSI